MWRLRFIADPARAAAASGIALDSSLGATNLRSGIGGLFLGSACVIVFCLLSTRRLLGGLWFVATMIGVVLAVRAASVVIDDTARASLPVLGAEAVLLALSLIGIFVESRRRRLQSAGGSQGA
jgi:preprotein translocase subunit SecD